MSQLARMGEMKKDDEADMADRVLMASDQSAMWAHIAVEAQTNPTYAIAYAILMLADEVALKRINEVPWSVSTDGTVTKAG